MAVVFVAGALFYKSKVFISQLTLCNYWKWYTYTVQTQDIIHSSIFFNQTQVLRDWSLSQLSPGNTWDTKTKPVAGLTYHHLTYCAFVWTEEGCWTKLHKRRFCSHSNGWITTKTFKGLFGNEKSSVTAGRETGQILITARVFGQRL